MKPRKPTSVDRLKQELPKDSVKLIGEVVSKNFSAFSKSNQVVVLGWLYPEEIILMIGFRNRDGIKQVNFSASTNHDTKKKNTMDQIYLAVDAIGSMVQQYIDAEGDIELPHEWTEFSLEGQKVYMMSDTVNTDLESKANALLDEES